jgi:predicted glycosyltransferase
VDAWIDIENPPQVQYLLPFQAAFENAGADVVVTARDHTVTLDLLRTQQIDFHSVGTGFGRRKVQKIRGLLNRSRQLLSLFHELGTPRLLLAASRPAAVAARRLGIPSFIISDYEYASLAIYRLTGSYILHPEVIRADAFLRRGIRSDRLLAFSGLKEDITFSTIDVENCPAHDFGIKEGDAKKVLFRPPAEDSHYYRHGSGVLALALLDHLSQRNDVVVIFTPRHAWQTEYLKRFTWKNRPINVSRPIPFVPLLKAVDAVVSSGGTMIREAAYLGIPAYSILRSRIGGLDRHLESLGRIRVLSSPEDFDEITFRNGSRRPPMTRNSRILPDLVELMLERTPIRPSRAR